MPKLVIDTGPEPGREIPLTGRVTLGREGDVTISDRKMSRLHARVFPDGKRYALADLGSRNGCLVNGTRVTRRVLQDGDRIQLGNTVLRFVDEAAAAAVESPGVGMPTRPSEETRPRQEVGEIVFSDRKPVREGTWFSEELGHWDLKTRLLMVLLGLGVAAALFLAVSYLSERLFR
jgi:hypothetical protein